MKKELTKTVFEHQSLRLIDNEEDQKLLERLKAFYGDKGVPYYSLTANGVKFNEYVGVIQIGKHLIEVLPKADKPKNVSDENNEVDSWRTLLVNMLKFVGVFDIKAPTSSSLKLNPNSILELYYALFLNEVEYLIHRGLIKKYQKTEGNLPSLKGSIKFGQHIQKNLIHKERFYSKYTTYSVDHVFHQILYQAISVVNNLNRNVNLSNKLASILLRFPEVSAINISEATFEKISFNRNTEHYRNAISIARLILLNYHPDISKGHNNVLAIMFDMNVLWEKFVVQSLRRSFRSIPKNSFLVESQSIEDFWKPVNAKARTIRPDIVIKETHDDASSKRIVLDTKWKNVETNKDISLDILRQMYIYHEYFNAKKVAIIFPGEIESIKGNFVPHKYSENIEKKCAMLPIPVSNKIEELHKNIFYIINNWINE